MTPSLLESDQIPNTKGGLKAALAKPRFKGSSQLGQFTSPLAATKSAEEELDQNQTTFVDSVTHHKT